MSFLFWGMMLILPLLKRAAVDFPAGDLGACFAGRLRGKIIRPAVDDHGAANDVLHAEAVCKKDGESMAAATEKGRQIPGVLGMGAIVGIVMPANIGKGVALVAGTAGSGMDMKGEDWMTAGAIRLRQAGDMGRYDHAPTSLIKPHHSTDVRVLATAPYLSNGRRPLADAYKLIQITHKVTSDHYIPGRWILIMLLAMQAVREIPGSEGLNI